MTQGVNEFMKIVLAIKVRIEFKIAISYKRFYIKYAMFNNSLNINDVLSLIAYTIWFLYHSHNCGCSWLKLYKYYLSFSLWNNTLITYCVYWATDYSTSSRNIEWKVHFHSNNNLTTTLSILKWWWEQYKHNTF